MSDWTLRSIIVALSVSGFGCSIAGAVFAICLFWLTSDIETMIIYVIINLFSETDVFVF